MCREKKTASSLPSNARNDRIPPANALKLRVREIQYITTGMKTPPAGDSQTINPRENPLPIDYLFDVSPKLSQLISDD